MSDRNKSSTFETSRERSRAEQPNTAMDTDFTQDTMLHFLQSSGGSVRNSDLLLHFRGFIRDHADRDRNRELFKKFVNSVATVQQVDGVSYVVLRKKFRGHVPGSGERGSPRAPAGKNTEPSEVSARQSPAGRAENPRQKPQKREVTTPAGATVLPAAGIILNNNNNNVETNLNLKQKQVVSTPAVSGRPAAAAQVRAQTPRVPQPPAQDKHIEVGQQSRGLGPPPAVRPVASAGRRHGETCHQPPVPEPRRGRPEGGLHQEPPLHPVSLLPQVALRRKYRQSYKAAVSYDEDEDDEEEEEIQTRRGSTGGVWPMSTSLGDSVRAMSASSPCIIDQCIPPSVVSSSSSSSSSERPLPKIYIQNVKGEMLPSHGPHWSLESGLGQRERWAGPGLEPGSVPELVSNRRSLPPETGSYTVSPDREKEVVHHIDVHTDPRYSQPAGVQTEPRQGPGQNHRVGLSSSHSSLLSPEAGLSSGDWPLSGSTRGSGWNGSNEELQSRAGKARADSKIQEALQRVHRTADSKSSAPWHHSAEHLHVEQEPTARVLPWRLSTGDLYDDRGEAESSEGSPFSSPLRPRPTVAGRMSSQLRNRMCRSLGADLDQLLQEEARGGSEAARLNRLQLISSTLSLPYNLSSSSLSSCSTPPRCHSLADLVERVEGREGRRSLTAASSSTAHHEGPSRQSLVPLEPREHAWLVKGAAGAWPDIYSLFREDSSLLNRRDFISGFTVLHWIAKHGDHRVLNTLWYGVEKAGLTFDINARSTSGHTPLHIAAIHSHKNVIRLLVSKFNADVRLRDTAGKKPWQYLSRNASSDVFELLGAPSQAAGSGEGGVVRADSNVKPEQHHRRRRRHHFSSAASGKRPVTTSGTMRVKRSSSLAAFLKHKSLHRFHGQQSDSSV